MAKKTDTVELFEDTETGEIFISGEPEANMPAPVPASHHVADYSWAITTPRKEMTALPYITTAVATVVCSAALLITGVLIGASL